MAGGSSLPPDGSRRLVVNGRATNGNGQRQQGKKEQKMTILQYPDLLLRDKDEVPDPDELGLEEELPGWHGYVEWETYPERKRRVREFMRRFRFLW